MKLDLFEFKILSKSFNDNNILIGNNISKYNCVLVKNRNTPQNYAHMLSNNDIIYILLTQNLKYVIDNHSLRFGVSVKNSDEAYIEMVKIENKWIGINPNNANKLFVECIDKKLLEDFRYYKIEKSQVYIINYKFDFSLYNNYERIYVKVINILLVKNNVALFDKSMKQIYNLKNQGYNIALVFIIQRDDVDYINVKEAFDFIYCYKFKCLKNSIKFLEKIPIKNL